MRRQGWHSREELDEAGERSNHTREVEMEGRLRWVRSYFFREQDGTLGTICLYEAESEADVREHARRGALPADEVRRSSRPSSTSPIREQGRRRRPCRSGSRPSSSAAARPVSRSASC
jgi:hypothetical protein